MSAAAPGCSGRLCVLMPSRRDSSLLRMRSLHFGRMVLRYIIEIGSGNDYFRVTDCDQ